MGDWNGYKRERMFQLHFQRGVTRIIRDDMAGAFGVFVLVYLTIVPAVLPFLFIENLRIALRVPDHSCGLFRA